MAKYYSLACVSLISRLLYATQPDSEEELPRCAPRGLAVEMQQLPPASVSGYGRRIGSGAMVDSHVESTYQTFTD